MDFHCAIIGEKEDCTLTLAFAEREEFFENQSLLSKIIVYQIRNFDELEKLAHEIRKNSRDSNISYALPRDGFFSVHPRPEKGIFDPGYDYCLLKYWFSKEDKERVLLGFKINNF